MTSPLPTRLPLLITLFLIVHLSPAQMTLLDSNSHERQLEHDCPKGCRCEEPNAIACEGLDIGRIPLSWPSSLEIIQLHNCSLLRTLNKNAFRRFQHLRELHIAHMPQLDVIDKFAFKGLPKLRLLSITSNPKLHTLHKNSFSAIGNDHSLRIIIKGNAVERVLSFAFRHANNLRELTIDERCFEAEPNAWASAEKIDFLTLKGACMLPKGAFRNVSRVHSLTITGGALDLKEGTFTGLEHVNEIQLRDNRIGLIEHRFLSGMNTVASIHLQSNQIGRVEPLALVGAENLGSLSLSYNTIREPLSSPECLKNDAQKFISTDNTFHCSCEMQWIQYYSGDPTFLSDNFCGREEAVKALMYYNPVGCPLATVETTSTMPMEEEKGPITSSRDVPVQEEEEAYVREGREGFVRWPNASFAITAPPLITMLFILFRVIVPSLIIQ